MLVSTNKSVWLLTKMIERSQKRTKLTKVLLVINKSDYGLTKMLLKN